MFFDDTVGETLGFAQIAESVGVEIEVETRGLFPDRRATGKYWASVADDSLRGENNREFVTKVPMTEGQAYTAIDKLTKDFEKAGTVVSDSVRAGVHIHINVRDLTLREVFTFATCYYVIEQCLVDHCGEGRQGNHFCLRTIDADVIVRELSRAAVGQRLRNLNTEDLRYCALNFLSLFKHGTLEFRALRTPEDLGSIKKWINLLLEMKENSKLYPNPRAVVENFSLGGEDNFVRNMLGKYSGMVLDNPGYKRKLRMGIRLAQEIAYSTDKWQYQKEVHYEM